MNLFWSSNCSAIKLFCSSKCSTVNLSIFSPTSTSRSPCSDFAATPSVPGGSFLILLLMMMTMMTTMMMIKYDEIFYCIEITKRKTKSTKVGLSDSVFVSFFFNRPNLCPCSWLNIVLKHLETKASRNWHNIFTSSLLLFSLSLPPVMKIWFK